MRGKQTTQEIRCRKKKKKCSLISIKKHGQQKKKKCSVGKTGENQIRRN